MLNDHDMRTFRQTASAVLKHNKYMSGYDVNSLVFLMECDAQRLMRESRDTGNNGYSSTRGYVLSTYTSYSGQLCCYASVSASLFDNE